MANYLVILKYAGRMVLPENPDQAKAEIQQLLLPHIMHNEFEMLRVTPWAISDQPTYSYSTEGDFVLLEVKLKLSDNEVNYPDTIREKITNRLQRGHFYNERIVTEHKDGHIRGLITFSELHRHHRYRVNFHYPQALEAVAGGDDDTAVVKEIQMLMQSGEMALGDYSLSTGDSSSQNCQGEEVSSNQTVVEVNVMINEFNIDFQDSDSIYYYVLGEVDACGCQLSYRYTCEEQGSVATHIGLNVHCSYQSLELDDYQDLIQQL